MSVRNLPEMPGSDVLGVHPVFQPNRQGNRPRVPPPRPARPLVQDHGTDDGQPSPVPEHQSVTLDAALMLPLKQQPLLDLSTFRANFPFVSLIPFPVKTPLVVLANVNDIGTINLPAETFACWFTSASAFYLGRSAQGGTPASSDDAGMALIPPNYPFAFYVRGNNQWMVKSTVNTQAISALPIIQT